MSKGRKLYQRILAAKQGELHLSALRLASKSELRALVALCREQSPSDENDEILGLAMVEIVHRFMAPKTKRKKS
jgi:hypothetical protein